MRKLIILAALIIPALSAAPALAHFGLILPERAMQAKEDGRSMGLTFAFTHPFEQRGMIMDRPASVTVHGPSGVQDITDTLTPAQVTGAEGFTAMLNFTRPGTYVVAVDPAPYWEPAEDVFIRHFAKTYVAAFGDDSGWDAELGLKTEIVPLTRPFGLWRGNAFQGIVKRDGAALPYAEVEVEYFNTTGVTAPSDLMITQTVRADGNGVFTYAPPGHGWWGFAALSTDDETLPHDGAQKAVELGAVLWVHFEEWPQ